jgi:hypothetical protein
MVQVAQAGAIMIFGRPETDALFGGSGGDCRSGNSFL